jgi:hypothetical protein
MLLLSNTSILKHAYVTLNPLHLCPERMVGDRHGFTDVFVGICNHTNKSTQKGIAYCIPPIYNMDLGRLSADITYHKNMGIEHAYIYDAECQRSIHIPESTHLCMNWTRTVRIHQRGQNWHINDCIHRAADDGWEWVLTKDVDEHLTFARPMSINDLVATNADVYTFGRVYENGQTACTDKRYAGTSDRTHLCLRWGGYRKYIVRTNAVWYANIHSVDSCISRKCNVKNILSNVIWLNHTKKKSHYPQNWGSFRKLL